MMHKYCTSSIAVLAKKIMMESHKLANNFIKLLLTPFHLRLTQCLCFALCKEQHTLLYFILILSDKQHVK